MRSAPVMPLFYRPMQSPPESLLIFFVQPPGQLDFLGVYSFEGFWLLNVKENEEQRQ